jgi:hypothetical protein
MRARLNARPKPKTMKRFIAISVLALCPIFASAQTVDLGAHGLFGVTPPKGWTLSSQKVEDSGFTLTLSPPGGENAKCIINITYVPDPQPVSKDRIQAMVLEISDQFVDQSVEKKKVIRELNLPGGAYGCYCVFTDASRVGKPPVRDEFKVAAAGIVAYNEDVMAAFSIGGDDEKGPDFAAMVAAVSSTTLKAKK